MRRLRQLFRADGRTVVVAMDHGMGLDVLPALNDTAAVLRGVVAGGADVVLASYGVASRYEAELAGVGLALRLDGGNTSLAANPAGGAMFSPMDALRIGAEGCACMGFPGGAGEVDSLARVSRYAAAAHGLGLPLIAEMLPGGFGPEPPKTVENVRLCARIGAECGADVIKTLFVGTEKEFKTVVDGCFCPVVVLGGEKSADLGGLLLVVEKAMSAGAAGVAIGRNVWKHPDPEGVTQALAHIVHGGERASEAGRNL